MDASTIPLNRLYNDLAYLWPVMSPPEEYAEEAAHWRAVLREMLGPGRHPILELGVGGGHNLSHLAGEFQATAVDISEEMLAQCKRLNPDVECIAGDMRSIRLGRTFRAVLIHDAINHMLSEADLLAAFTTAAAHLEPGGIFITSPENLCETFQEPQVEIRTHCGEEFELTYLEYAHDPDPTDSTLETVLTYLIRKGHQVRVEHDRMITGIFPRAVWDRLMAEAGFAVEERSCRLELTGTEYAILIGSLRCRR